LPFKGAAGAATLSFLDVLGALNIQNMNPLIFVAGVPADVDGAALRTAFSAVAGAAVSAAWVMRSPIDGSHKGYGFVEFVLPSGALAVMQARSVHCGGVTLRPEAACTRQYSQMFSRTLFVDGFSRETTTEDKLREVASAYGQVTEVSIPLFPANHPQKGTPKGYAFIEFARTDCAHHARSGLDGKELVPGQSALRVSFSNPTKTMIARPAPSPAVPSNNKSNSISTATKQQQGGSSKGGGGESQSANGGGVKRPASGNPQIPLGGNRGMQHMPPQQWRGLPRGGMMPPHMGPGPGYGPPRGGPPPPGMMGPYGMPYPPPMGGMPYGGPPPHIMMPPQAQHQAAMYAQQQQRAAMAQHMQMAQAQQAQAQQQQAAAMAAAAAAAAAAATAAQQQQQHSQYMAAAYAQQQHHQMQAPPAGVAHDPWAAYHSTAPPDAGQQASQRGAGGPYAYGAMTAPPAAAGGQDPSQAAAAAAWSAYYASQAAAAGPPSHPAAAAAAQQSYYAYTQGDAAKKQRTG